jgi:hypothetical protein
MNIPFFLIVTIGSNKDQCKIIRIGKNNHNYDYFMGNEMTISIFATKYSTYARNNYRERST